MMDKAWFRKLMFEWSSDQKSDRRNPTVLGALKRDELSESEAHIDRLAGGRAPVEEVVDNMRGYVDGLHASEAATLSWKLARAFSGGYESRASDGALVSRRPTMPPFENPVQAQVFHMCAVLMPDAVKAVLEALVRAGASGQEAGPARAERRALLEAAFARHRSLTEEYEALREAASQLDPPVMLPALTGIREYRFASDVNAEKRAEREARLAAGRVSRAGLNE